MAVDQRAERDAEAKAKAIAAATARASTAKKHFVKVGRHKRPSKTATKTPISGTGVSKTKLKKRKGHKPDPIQHQKKPKPFIPIPVDLDTVTPGTLVTYYEPGLMPQPKLGQLKGSASDGWIFYGGKTGTGNSTPIRFPHLPLLLDGTYLRLSDFTKYWEYLKTDTETVMDEIQRATQLYSEADDSDAGGFIEGISTDEVINIESSNDEDNSDEDDNLKDSSDDDDESEDEHEPNYTHSDLKVAIGSGNNRYASLMYDDQMDDEEEDTQTTRHLKQKHKTSGLKDDRTYDENKKESVRPSSESESEHSAVPTNKLRSKRSSSRLGTKKKKTTRITATTTGDEHGNKTTHTVITPRKSNLAIGGMDVDGPVDNTPVSTDQSPASYLAAVNTPKLNSFSMLRHLTEVQDDHTKSSNSTGKQTNSERRLKRCNVVLWVKASDSNTDEVTKNINNFLAACKDIESDASNVKLAPWKATYPNQNLITRLGNKKNGPKNVKYPAKQLDEYVHGVWRNRMKEDRSQYVRILLSISPEVEWDDLMDELNNSWGMTGGKQRINNSPSDCTDPIVIGYLTRSHYSMLESPCMKMLHRHTSGIDLGMHMKGVSMTKGSKKNSDYGPRAIHIEVDKSKLSAALTYCKRMWPTSLGARTDYPLGINLHFVSLVASTGMKLKNTSQSDRSARVQEIIYPTYITVERHDEILPETLEYEFLPSDKAGEEGLYITFREYLMRQKVHDGDYKDHQLFFAISRGNPDRGNNIVHIAYFKLHETEARHFLDGLPVILRDELFVEPSDFVTHSALLRVEGGTWNPVKRTFKDSMSIFNDDVGKHTTDTIPGWDEKVLTVDTTAKSPTKEKPTPGFMDPTHEKVYQRAMGNDDDTASIVSLSKRKSRSLRPEAVQQPPGSHILPVAVSVAGDVMLDDNSVLTDDGGSIKHSLRNKDDETTDDASQVTGETRQSRVEAAVNETTEIFKATIFDREKKHNREMQQQQAELEAERSARKTAQEENDRKLAVLQQQMQDLLTRNSTLLGIPPKGGGAGTGADNP